MNRKTQCDRILSALRRGPLTTASAAYRFDVFSFHRRLADLRQRGHIIEGRPVVKKNSDGQTVRFLRYHLVDSA